MKVVKDVPPNHAKIASVFGFAAISRACFTYGDTVYSPNTTDLSLDLQTHEATHMRQQGDDPEAWWDTYLVDATFRFEQELEAYQAQYAYARDHLGRGPRRELLKRISHDLASAMYGNVIDKTAARALISAPNPLMLK